MRLNIPIGAGLALTIMNSPENPPGFPTARLQKGLLLLDHGEELSEEGVGFGVPVIMRGLQAIFPAAIQLNLSEDGPLQVVRAIYTLNLEEKIGKPSQKEIESKVLYTVKNYLAALMRRLPSLRGLLTSISNLMRKVFAWETMYEQSEFSCEVWMRYTINQQAGIVNIAIETLDVSTSGITEIIIMNEQGARTFDHYLDSSGNALQGYEIGCWDEVTAQEASFISTSHAVAFTLERVASAKLFRGRELIDSRLSWAGFGYSFPAHFNHFEYQLKIGRIK
jgi:hypothetical protein